MPSPVKPQSTHTSARSTSRTQRHVVSAGARVQPVPVSARTDGRALLRADATHLAVAGIVKSRRDGEGRRDRLNIPSRGILVDGLV
jgi:hypothetical protein